MVCTVLHFSNFLPSGLPASQKCTAAAQGLIFLGREAYQWTSQQWSSQQTTHQWLTNILVPSAEAPVHDTTSWPPSPWSSDYSLSWILLPVQNRQFWVCHPWLIASCLLWYHDALCPLDASSWRLLLAASLGTWNDFSQAQLAFQERPTSHAQHNRRQGRPGLAHQNR